MSCVQSLANDLMEIKDNVVKLNDKPVLLSEKDDLWVKLKALHIADVLTGLKDYLDEIKKRNPNAAKMGKKDGDDAPSLTDMSKVHSHSNTLYFTTSYASSLPYR